MTVEASSQNRPSVTFWARLEPSIRGGDFDGAFAARIGDPLWLLGRQLQLGEFEGSDRGSAIRTDIVYQKTEVNQYRAGSHAPVQYRLNVPLNSLVEPEGIQPELRMEGIQADLRTAAALGSEFMRFVRAQLASSSDAKIVQGYYVAYYKSFAQQDDDDSSTTRFLEIASGNAIDGISLYTDFRGTYPNLPPVQAAALSRQLKPAAMTGLTTAAMNYVDYFEDVFAIPPKDGQAWANEELEYQFELSAAKDKESSLVLSADEYRGGEIDWYSFSVDPDSDMVASVGDNPVLSVDTTSTVVPSHLQFRGMPSRRWWQFEDAQLDVGSIDVNKTDIPKMALISMIVNQANSWFIMPLPLPRGTVTRIKKVTVTDTFGTAKDIAPANSNPISPGDTWEMFTISQKDGSKGAPDPSWSNALFLPPVPGPISNGDVLESVNFLRDQMAEMVWGVEDTVQNRAGDSIAGYVDPTPSRSPPKSSGAQGSSLAPQYVLTNSATIPKNWIPFLAVQVPNTPMTELQEGAMTLPPSAHGNPPERIPPRGVILTPPNTQDPYYIREEEVPREGTTVTRRFRRARWTDGSTHVWIGRKRDIGKGEGSSGLRFDAIFDPATSSYE